MSGWQALRPASQPHHDMRRAVFGSLVCAANTFPASPPQLLWYHCPFFTPCCLRAAARSPQLHSSQPSKCLVIVQIIVFILLTPDSNSSHHEIYIMALKQCFCADNSSCFTLRFTVASLLFLKKKKSVCVLSECVYVHMWKNLRLSKKCWINWS